VTNTTSIRVIFGDTDAMGIVYHSNYIRWFEVGRTELLREVGYSYRHWAEQGYHLPVIHVYCHYLKAAKYDDLLLIETRVETVNRASVKFQYKIWDERHEEEMTEGYTVHACVKADGKITRLPWDLIAVIKQALD